ncbi:MAG: aminotransferase class V-fold PLP-dependent enzyme [Pirellulaceae bacterium]
MSANSSIQLKTSEDSRWNQMRAAFPVAKKWAYFDHAAVAPIPQKAHDLMMKYAAQALHEGDAVWPDWSKQYEATRDLAASLINAQRTEIGLVPNTSFGINMISEGFPWQSGDNVVLPAHEFPSNVYPWLHLADRGVEVRTVPLDGNRVCPNRMADACDSRTRIVSVSWVGYASGYRLDPKEMATVAHDAGALFFLDAIQGLGVFPLDVRDADIDFLAADGHKWMCGPEGAGILFIKQELLKTIRPLNVGWNSVAQGNDFSRVELNIRDAASRYESGTQNLAGFIGLLGSLQTLQEFGLANDRSDVGERILDLTDHLCESLGECGCNVLSDRDKDSVKSGIVLFELPGHDCAAVKKQLFDERIIVSNRAGKLRAAPHAYNDEQDIERLASALKKIRHA